MPLVVAGLLLVIEGPSVPVKYAEAGGRRAGRGYFSIPGPNMPLTRRRVRDGNQFVQEQGVLDRTGILNTKKKQQKKLGE